MPFWEMSILSMLSSIWRRFYSSSLKKDQLMQKRRDIFVESLVVLGYIVQNEEGKYELAVDFDKNAWLLFALIACFWADYLTLLKNKHKLNVSDNVYRIKSIGRQNYVTWK